MGEFGRGRHWTWERLDVGEIGCGPEWMWASLDVSAIRLDVGEFGRGGVLALVLFLKRAFKLLADRRSARVW